MTRYPTSLLGPLAALTIVAGCGGADSPAGDPENPAVEVPAAPETEPDTAPTAGTGSSSASRPVLPPLLDPVPFEQLMTVLPAPSGWTRSQERGHEVSEPVRQSLAEARYERGDVQVDVAVVDTGRSRVLLAPYEMFLASGFEERSSDGLTRAVRVGGAPAYERWSGATRSGEIVVVVASRFIVRVSSRTAPGLAPLSSVVNGIDMNRLRGLQ